MLFNIFIGCLLAFLGYLTIKKFLPTLINFFDNANSNDRLRLPASYENPIYYRVKKDGSIDTTKRWFGWDGWYFLTLLPAQNPAQLIRGSVMTGLYGVEGVDNYNKLMLYLASDNVVECLFMFPQPGMTLLSHEYLPKNTNLQMQPDRLEVNIAGHVAVKGKWPEYEFYISNSQDGLELSLHYKAQDIIWWADIPGIFTYFTTFGQTEGELKRDGEVLQKITSMGCFEHGYAKKWLDYDPLLIPLRLWKQLFHFNTIHYHYDLLFTEEGVHGGVMLAKAFGINARDRGGLYLPGGEYITIKKIKHISYENPKFMENLCEAKPIPFYTQWHVEAETEKGPLHYTAKQVYLPAHVAKHLVYYSFLFEGMIGNKKLNGVGYGEYVRM